MSSLRYLPCERTHSFPEPATRNYSLPCPAWCPADKRTVPAYIDFSRPGTGGPGNVDNAGADFVDGDDIIGKQTIIDSIGNEWFLRPKHDNTVAVGEWIENDAFCGEPIWNITNNLNGLSPRGNLELLPSHLSACSPNHVVNFSLPWTLYHVVSLLDGQLEFLATPGTGLTVDAEDAGGGSVGVVCGPNISIKVSRILASTLNRITISFTDVCGTTRTVPIIRYDQNTCLLLGVSVDPCEHKLSVYAETTHVDQLIWWEYPSHNSPSGNFNNPQLIEKARYVCFEIDCEDWWIIQRDKEYGIDGRNTQSVAQHTAFFQPPSLWQYFDRLQKVGWNFGSSAGTNVDLLRFQWSNRFRTCDELCQDLYIMGPRKRKEATTITFADTPYTVLLTDYEIKVDASGGAVTATLPAVADSEGLDFIFKKMDSSANAVTVAADGAETIDSAATFVLQAQYDALTVFCDDTEWDVV